MISDTRDTRFRPAYVGVAINALSYLQFMFDDFVVSITDPRYITFIGLKLNATVELWNDLGGLVVSGTANERRLTLSVVHDVVVGTGKGGVIVVKYSEDNVHVQVEHVIPRTDAILGGDVYELVPSLS